MATSSIPVARLDDYLSDDPKKKQKFVQTIGDALVDIGFFALENHGVSSELINECYKISEQYFCLSQDEKKRDEIDL